MKDYPNASMLESQNVIWGGYSMVQVELDGIRELLKLHTDWDFLINLSGQDYPLKSQYEIKNFLNKNRGKNFIKIANQAVIRPNTMNRLENYFVETDVDIKQTALKRAVPKGVVPYIGGQWMILTKAACEFFACRTQTEDLQRFYRNTLIADESFFQTAMMNTSFDGTIVNDDKRAIIWIPDGDIKLRPKTLTVDDLPFLLDGNNLFARKFDEAMDSDVLDIIEASFVHYDRKKTQIASNVITANLKTAN